MRILNPIVITLLLLCMGEVTLAQSGGGIPQAENADFSKSITLYPNPAAEYINVKLGSLQASHVKLTLYNIIGNEVAIETELMEENILRVRVKDLSTGYYLLAVRDESIQFRGTYKFLKR